MVNEVNNIIFNTLIAERAIHLPGVGTLSVVRKSAEMASSNAIIPPTYAVEFSSCTTATSVVEVIAREAEIESIKAEDIYSRWLEKVRTESTLTIEGVGKLQNKSFVPDSAFISLFAPVTTPIKIKRQKNKAAITAALVATFIGVGVVFGAVAWFFFNESSAPVAETVEPEVITTTEIAEVEDITVNEVVEEVILEDIPEAEPIVEESSDWTKSADIRHWVIAGSYSTPENADIAVKDIMSKHDDIYCNVFSLGKMYAVAIYGSSEREECDTFIREHSNEFNQIWVFTPKANR